MQLPTVFLAALAVGGSLFLPAAAQTASPTLQRLPIQQTLRARQSEGSTYTGTLNRVQQAFYLENGRFGYNLSELRSGIPSETADFRYSTSATQQRAVNLAQAKSRDLRSFKGVVQFDARSQQVRAILCTTREPGMSAESADRSATNMSQPCQFE